MPLREHHRAAARDIMRTTIDRSEADRPGAATAALAGGANDFLTKPFSPKKLVARIHEILDTN